MDKKDGVPKALPISLRPRNVYGLRIDVKGNVQFNLSQEVIYPVEGVLAFHDYVSNKQRFLRLPENINVEIITISAHRKLLAVLEANLLTCSRNICIYELATLKKRRSLPLPETAKDVVINQILFTADSKSILMLTKPPDELLYLLMLDVGSTVIEARPTNNIPRGTADCIAPHPQDVSLVAVAGDNLLLFMARGEKGFTVSNNIKVNFKITSMAFIAMDLLMLGTDQDELIMVENGEIKLTQQASEADLIDILWDQETLDKEIEHRFTIDFSPVDKRVKCLSAFSRGFAFAIYNKVFVFERVSKFKLERKTILTVPITIYAESLHQITNMAIDHKMETVIVTTKHAQIYIGVLIVPETLKVKNLTFQPLGAFLHIGDIVDISLCSWKPVIMTASKDQTIRIWNYETDKIELVRKFQVDVNIVELNNTGLMAAIGFSDQLRITQIFMDELNIVKTYNFPSCRDVKYSNYGHLMAAAFDNNIAITSVYNLEVLHTLKGHNGAVLSIAWTKNDRYLISGGKEGAIYQWDVDKGSRVKEIVQKGTEYRSVCVTMNEPLSIYAATNFGVIREFQNAELVRELVVPSSKETVVPLIDLCLSRSDQIMFVTNEIGDLLNVQVPFLDAGGGSFQHIRFFVSRINKLRFSYDGTMLVAVSKSGTLAIWVMDNIDGKIASLDSDLLRSQEILIPRNVLQEKNDQIISLETRLKQQAEEFQYQISQNTIFDGQQLAEVHRTYCAAIEELKTKNNEIEERHNEEMNQITFQINDIKEDHRKQLENLANQYSERMLIEYQKFTNLRETMLQLRESYEGKLKMSAGTLQDTVEGLESDYKTQLDERKELIRELMKEMQDKKIEFIEYCRQVEVENDRNSVEMQLKYENKLTAERNETNIWRGNAGVLQKKYDNLTKDIDNLFEEVETLKEEHNLSQRKIERLMRNIEELQKDVADRDYAINAKEKRIHDLLHKNQELDKYKQVLGHKITELNAQIEPREFQINDKRKHILELENELADLNQNNSQLELQLKELKDKYLSSVTELKLEQHRARAGRECIIAICSDIYYVTGKINSPNDLKTAVVDLFHKHAKDDELKRFLSTDGQVRDEFQRQRAQIERVLKMYKSRSDEKDQEKKYQKLYQENLVLMDEIEKLRVQNDSFRAKMKTDSKFGKKKSNKKPAD